MPDSAAFCPSCGRSMRIEPAAKQSVGALRENFAGALAYFSFLPATFLLLRDPYRKNSFVRFHAVQCLLFWLLSVAMAALVRLFTLLLLFVPLAGPLLALLLVTMVALAAVFVWIVLVVKAFQGERFALPFVGELAERYSSAG